MAWTKAFAGLVGAVCLALLLAVRNSSLPREHAKPVQPIPPPGLPQSISARKDADLFSSAKVLALTLEISSSGMQSLREQPREWTRATLRTEDTVYRDVGVHIKGSQGSLQTIDERPSLTISLNHFNPGERFYGLRKIHLNNSAEDPSAMTQILCGELCREAGLPAARSSYAALKLNRRELGLYVLTEGLTREFLSQHFGQTDGNLYDGGFRKDIDQRLERIGGHGPDTQADRLSLLAASREPDRQRRWDRLQKVLDTERFVSLLAMTSLTWNWDGYPMARNNYRIYHDPQSDKLVFIPHGLDQMFWEPQGSIYPRMRGLVAAAVMNTPEGRAAYRARLAELHRHVFLVPSLQRRIDDLAALIRPYRPDATEQGARLKKLIAGRSKSVARQLGAAPDGE